eukprot:scaffold37256_cov183-Amphora_coffeaeformis.AAC.1
MLNSDAGSIVVGLVLVLIAGCANGSWNVSFRPTHGFAVGRQQPSLSPPPPLPLSSTNDENNNDKTTSTLSSSTIQHDLEFHQAWILFQLYAVLINIPICLFWAGGPGQVANTLQASSVVDMFWVVLFSVLWGIGSICFGVACKVAGVGLGTNLSMGIIMVLGTFLPLCLEGAIATVAGGVVLIGLVVCCLGLALAVISLQTRDVDGCGRKREESSSGRRQQQQQSPPLDGCGDDTTLPAEMTVTNSGMDLQETKQKYQQQQQQQQQTNSSKEYSTTYKVAVCVMTGIFGAQLQFAFVFGQDMVDYAKGVDDVPSSGRNAVIWLFALPCGAPASLLYGILGKPSHIPWSRMYTSPWYRHVGILLTAAIPWVSHIHLYGFANTLLPDDLAASVAWPVLMMTTVVSGMFWSIILGEWADASQRSKLKFYQGLGMVSLGVVIIMTSVSI